MAAMVRAQRLVAIDDRLPLGKQLARDFFEVRLLRQIRQQERLAAIGQKLQDAGGDAEKIRRLGQEYARVESQLEQAMHEWELMSKGELPA